MRVSQRLDYAVRVLVAIAARADEWTAAGDMAEELGIPRRFAEQQVTALARLGVVECRRGAHGGCRLARPAKEISVADVVRALQGEVLDVPHTSGSAVAEMWARAAGSLEEALARETLEGLVDRQRALDARQTPLYYI